MLEQLQTIIKKIEQNKPVILNYTNYVTMDFMANALSAISASPIMSCSYKEAKDLVKIASGININIGTLENNYQKTVENALKANKNYNKPCVLDPVGAGASNIRTKISKQYFKSANIIKGNASEILALEHDLTVSKGIDSTNSLEQVKNKAHNLALKNNKTIVITGEKDLISNGKESNTFAFGSKTMPKVIGTGCVLGAIICAFASVENNYYKASSLAVLFYTLIGEYTTLATEDLGSFKENFLNNLNKPNWSFIENKINNLKQ